MEALKGILALDPESRRKELGLRLAPHRDETGKVFSDHTYLLETYVPPVTGVIQHFALEAELEELRSQYQSFVKTRIRKASDVSKLLIKQWAEAKRIAAAGMLREVASDTQIADFFDGKSVALDFSKTINVPVSLFFGTVIAAEDVKARVMLLQPFGRMEIDEAEFANELQWRREAIAKAQADLDALFQIPGRLDDKGRDLWLSHTAALAYWNEKAISPCDAAGRATKNKALLAFLAAIKIGNAAEDLSIDWLKPTEMPRLYHSLHSGGYYLNQNASRDLV